MQAISRLLSGAARQMAVDCGVALAPRAQLSVFSSRHCSIKSFSDRFCHSVSIRRTLSPFSRGRSSHLKSSTNIPLGCSTSRQSPYVFASLEPTSSGFSTFSDPMGEPFEAPSDKMKEEDATPAESAFLQGLMPSAEIGAQRFLKKHPEHDGRGDIVAIFDSGVDPGAAGLTVTSEGKHKVIDVVDCTGSGDVDTSKVVRADADGMIEGASGRQLRVNPEWKNPSGEWHVGVKHLFELFTKGLTERVKKERRKSWDAKHRQSATEELRRLSAFDAKNPKPATDKLKKEREDLQARVDLLKKLAEDYDDRGPIVDCVVWRDDKDTWRAAIDTTDLEEEGSSVGKLADFVPLTNFRLERKFGTFSKVDSCNFAANVYDDGNVLSLVTDSSPHGTHVAGITAACHPEEPDLNGVAPGAQIVSCKIGDTRLGSMETGTGLTRALIAVIENKCDLINMSYGEPTSTPDVGRFVSLANEIVHKHGVIFVSSAGNDGPALSTVGAPGGTSSAIIGIGAYVSPAMAASAHSLVSPPSEGLQYTWSSRGPTPDGDLGVGLSAPGGAVAPVPAWTLQKRQLMNGTSMSSPCACGGIALVLSALKAQGLSSRPNLVRTALENSAASLGSSPHDALTHGRGLLQVDKAVKYLEKCADLPDVRYVVEVSRTSSSAPATRGVYLRDLPESMSPVEFRVTVSPHFHEDADNLDVRAAFEERIKLDSSAPDWVQAPENVLLPHNGRNFCIRVDPSGLPQGLHFAEVTGTDMSRPWRGPVFRIPVTVIKPTVLPQGAAQVATFNGLKFLPGDIKRHFIAVPAGATWAELTMRSGELDTPRQLVLHTLQLLPQERHTSHELRTYLTFNSHSTKQVAIEVQESKTLEVTLAHFWSSASGTEQPCTIDLEVEFHGLKASSGAIHLDGATGTVRVNVRSAFGTERLAPNGVLNRLQTPLAPTEAKIEALSPNRDELPDGRQIHALHLTYKFTVTEAGKYTPRLPVLNNRVYDSELESQLYMVHDSNKKLLAVGDVYPKEVKLTKGDHTIRYRIRHDNVGYLEKLKGLVLRLERTLEDKASFKLTTHSSLDGVITNTKKLTSATMLSGEMRSVFFAPPPADKLPKDAAPGTLLRGRATFGKLSSSNGDNGAACPAASQLVYIVPPAVKEDKDKKGKDDAKKTAAEKLQEEMRDVKIKVLTGLPTSTDEERAEFEQLAKDLKAEYPGHVPLFVELLHKVDGTKEKRRAVLPEVVSAADKVISLIDTKVLADWFAQKSEPEGEDAAKLKKEHESNRDILVDALSRKGLALAELEVPEKDETASKKKKSKLAEQAVPGPTKLEDKSSEASESKPALPDTQADTTAAPAKDEGLSKAAKKPAKEAEAKPEEGSGNQTEAEADAFEENFRELRKWVDTSLAKHGMLVYKREKRAGRLGHALKALNKVIDDDSKATERSAYEARAELYDLLGWPQWANYERSWLRIRFPGSYPLF